jgi:Family of unknown function (DUF5990)
MTAILKLRITVLHPLPGVSMLLQRGRDGLLPPTLVTPDAISFDFEVRVEPGPNFLGEYTQGPKTGRFVYVNSGSYAAQPGTLWNRRAKVSLMTITAEQLASVLAQQGHLLEARIPGVAKDGGPVCASVRPIAWCELPG